jgi:hypothetical protein
MPPGVGPVFRILWQEAQNIHFAWMVFRQLFGTSPDRIELLNRFGGLAFGLYQRVLNRDLILAIFRLLDPATQRGGRDENLSLERLVNEVAADSPSCAAKLTPLLAEIRRLMDPHADLRNKVIAHNDLHTTPTRYDGTSTVLLPSRETVEGVLERMRKMMNIVQANYGEGESVYFNASMPELGDGETLVRRLTQLENRVESLSR